MTDATVSNKGIISNPPPVLCETNSESTTNNWKSEKHNNANANSITKNSRNATGNSISKIPKTTDPAFITNIIYIGNVATFRRFTYKFAKEKDDARKALKKAEQESLSAERV